MQFFENNRVVTCKSSDPEVLRKIVVIEDEEFLLPSQLKTLLNKPTRLRNVTMHIHASCVCRQHLGNYTLRGIESYNKGLNVWEMKSKTWTKGYDGPQVFPGVGIYNFMKPKYIMNAWVWNIGRNLLVNAGEETHNVYPLTNNIYNDDEMIHQLLVILDMDKGTLAYVLNGYYLGIATSGLLGLDLYPIGIVEWGKSDLTMKFVGRMDSGPESLQSLCRDSYANKIGIECLEETAESMELPNSVIKYLCYSESD